MKLLNEQMRTNHSIITLIIGTVFLIISIVLGAFGIDSDILTMIAYYGFCSALFVVGIALMISTLNLTNKVIIAILVFFQYL